MEMEIQRNYFYDLPYELRNKIYLYDNTYHDEYEKIIKIIKIFPKFVYNNIENVYFNKIFYNIHLEQTLRIENLNYKKSFLMAIKYFVKPNTFINH